MRKGLAYPGIKRITYLKSGMSFSEGLTFYSNNGCLEMLSWVREGSIDVYCECIVENANINHVEKSDGESRHMEG